MLVLRRKAGEAVVLNGVIKVYVLAVEGERVKLGFDAPPDVIIVRQELLEDNANESSSAGSYFLGITDALLGLCFSLLGKQYHNDVVVLGNQRLHIAYLG